MYSSAHVKHMLKTHVLYKIDICLTYVQHVFDTCVKHRCKTYIYLTYM